jgi:hypothetical protein
MNVHPRCYIFLYSVNFFITISLLVCCPIAIADFVISSAFSWVRYPNILRSLTEL